MARRKFTRRSWSREEDELIDGHVRALADGRYPNRTAAARACARDIKRLYVSLRARDPNHHLATRERPFDSLVQRLVVRSKALGLKWTSTFLTPSEERVIDRYVRALVNGRYHDSAEAARVCMSELRGNTDAGRLGTMKFRGVWRRIYNRASRLNRPWAKRLWSKEDSRVVERYARAVVAGRYSTALLAAQACREELRRARGLRRPARPLRAVLARLLGLTRAMGLEKYPRWTKAEREVLDRYLRALYAGSFPHVRPAAEACAAEMRRLLGRAGKGTGDTHSGGRHTVGAVFHAMIHASMRLRLPRWRGALASLEGRLYEKYARATAAGQYADALQAAVACQDEVSRIYSRVGARNPLHVQKVAPRLLAATQQGIVHAAARLKLQYPGRRWQPAEERIFDGWLRWYSRYRRVRRLQPLVQAANGLCDDLAKAGYRRTPRACRSRLMVLRRKMM